MPVKKEDAYRALELLEQYHSKLTKPQDRQLRSAIEKVIRVFKGRLFQALLDIQEYYEITLLNETKSMEEKTEETNQVVSRWEKDPPIVVQGHNNHTNDFQSEELADSDSSFRRKKNRKQPSASKGYTTVNKSTERWLVEEIELERGEKGLGFSIAGGTDNPHLEGDPSIFITKLIPGASSDLDGRLKVNDILTSVNGVSMEGVTHSQCVEALKRSGRNVVLVVRRPMAENEVAVELIKANKGLGFRIAGGVDSPHIEGDPSIFITKVTKGGTAEKSGMIEVGDKLLVVNDISLDHVTHEDAVNILKSCQERVNLIISKKSPGENWNEEMENNNNNNEEEEEEEEEKPVVVKEKKSKKNKTVNKKNSSMEQKIHPVSRDPRRVILNKGEKGLGFNIVGGEEAEGIFISYILEGGVADLSGKIFKGDQILSVNGIDMRQATHDQAASALKGSGGQVEILVQHKINEFHEFESKIQDLRDQMNHVTVGESKSPQNKGLFIRALFNYDSSEDPEIPGEGINFKYGDVFHVITALDDQWWQVQKVIPEEETIGIIPSQQRVEKNEKIRIKSFKDGKKKKKKNKSNENLDESQTEENILSYEPMVQKEVNYARPVIILGPLKDQMNDDLLSEYPQYFENCVPHTTRQKREGEVDGRDYHFVASRALMEKDIENQLFIEAGQYSDNLYGTSIQSVNDVAVKDKHCVLDVSANAIKRLRAASLHPIAILIKPPTPDHIRLWTPKTTEDQAKKAFDKVIKLEKDYGLYFTTMISGESVEEIYDQIKSTIQNHSGSIILIPAPRENEN